VDREVPGFVTHPALTKPEAFALNGFPWEELNHFSDVSLVTILVAFARPKTPRSYIPTGSEEPVFLPNFQSLPVYPESPR